MKILFLTQTGPLGPSSRYRVYQLLPGLEKLGIQGTVSPAIDDDLYRTLYLNPGGRASRRAAFLATWKARRVDLERLAGFDAVFVQKGVFPGLYAGFESRIARRRPMVFDFDDAIWLPREGGSPLLRLVHRERAVQEILRRAAAVVAGNDYLADYARRFNRAVTVVPSAIDVGRYSLVSAHHSNTPSLQSPAPPLIGWMGSSTTLPYLKPLRPVFQRLGVNPRVIGSGDPSALGFDVDFRPWRLETESAELAQLSIGIAPLPDTPWEHGKCGVKLLQYMAAGIPVVASPVGVHNRIVRHGVNGFLARNEAEWIDGLSRLISDADLRARLGAAGRQTVEQDYALPRAAEQVAGVLRDLR